MAVYESLLVGIERILCSQLHCTTPVHKKTLILAADGEIPNESPPLFSGLKLHRNKSFVILQMV